MHFRGLAFFSNPFLTPKTSFCLQQKKVVGKLQLMKVSLNSALILIFNAVLHIEWLPFQGYSSLANEQETNRGRKHYS